MKQTRSVKYLEQLGMVADAQTGEMLPVVTRRTKNQGPLEFALFKRRELMDVLLELDSATKTVAILILRDMRDYTNLYKGTYKKIAQDSGLSESSVRRAMVQLQQNDVIRMFERGSWLVNPNLVWTVDSDEQKRMQFWYDSIPTMTERRTKPKKEELDKESQSCR